MLNTHGETLTATVGDSISMTRGFVRERAAGLTARAIASAYPRTLLENHDARLHVYEPVKGRPVVPGGSHQVPL